MNNKIHNTHPVLREQAHPITIALIGCGGSGSLMLTRLARTDYALRQCGRLGLQITVFDDDTVEPYNVGRQMFSVQDIGQNKAVALVSKVNMCFESFHKAVPEKFKIEDNEIPFNIVITAVDNAQFRMDFNTHFRKAVNDGHSYNSAFQNYYWMDLGNSKNSGQCVLASKKVEQPEDGKVKFLDTLPSVVERFPNQMEADDEKEQGNGCSYQAKLHEQNLFINDALTANAAHLLWELLIDGYADKAGFFMNLGNFNTNPIKL